MNRPTIITVCGKARHGKNTFADLLKKHSKKRIFQIAYADYLKFIAEKYFGWNGKKDEQGRHLLQQLGTEQARTYNPDIWVNVVIELIKGIGHNYDYVVITDTRFPNEILRWDTKGFDFETVLVSRPGFQSELTEEQKQHPSETALDDYIFDYSIEAKDIEELEKEVIKYVKEWLGED